MALALKFNHPFMEGLTEFPSGKKKDLQKIKSWLLTQPHIPELSDEFLILFLHACYYSFEKTKSAIENYFTIRATHPAIFGNRDLNSEKVQVILGLGHLIRLPTLTPEGYRVMLYSVRDPDPTKLNFSDAIKVFCMYNDCVLSEDELKEGYVVLFDMKDVQLGHLARVSLPALRCFMMYIQEAHPVRLKAVHVLNTASWIHHVMRLIIPLVKSEILNLVKFHRGNTPDKFPIEILPKEYGGNAGSIDELDQETLALLKRYEAWMLESSQLMSDESKRPKKASWWGLWTGSSKGSTTVELDEKTILKNLQID